MKLFKEYLLEKKWDTYQQHKYKDPIKDAVYDYVSGMTSGVNDSLRKGATSGSSEVIKKLDAVFKEEDLIDVYRTVDWDYMNNIYKLNKDNINSFIGKTLVNKGYMSTSKECISPWSSVWDENELILHIVSSTPYPCIDVNKMFSANEIDCEFQKELLLPRNTKMRLKSYTINKRDTGNKKFAKNGTYMLELEIL